MNGLVAAAIIGVGLGAGLGACGFLLGRSVRRSESAARKRERLIKEYLDSGWITPADLRPRGWRL